MSQGNGNGKYVEGQQGHHSCWRSHMFPTWAVVTETSFQQWASLPSAVSSRTWGTCQRTAMSLKLSFIRAVHEAGTRGGSRLRQKLMPSGFCWTAEVLLLRCKSGCWKRGRVLAFLNLFLINTSLSGKRTFWDIPYVRAAHPLQHALTTTWGYDLSLKIFPLFFQLAGYQFFWGTWKEKIITSFELITPQNDPSLWGSLLTLSRVCYSLFCTYGFLNSLMKSWAWKRYRYTLPPVSFRLCCPWEILHPGFPLFKNLPSKAAPSILCALRWE